MKLNDLLPPMGFPRAQTYVSADSHWTLGDTEQSYNASGGHHLYSADSITYHLNSSGYRCPEFSDGSLLRMISIGCSYTYGVGLPQEALYHERFAERLRREVGVSVVNWNLGSGAISNNYISRVLHFAVPQLDPDLILIFFTHASRREYISATNEVVKYRPNARDTDPAQREIFRLQSKLSSEYDDQLSFFRDYKSIETLLTGRIWAYGFCNPIEIDGVVSHLNSAHRIRDYRIANAYRGIPDTARDHRHPGPRTHDNIYQCFWDWFIQSKGFEEVGIRISGRASRPSVAERCLTIDDNSAN